MSTITQYFEQAELALAAYSNLNAEMSPEAYRSALQQDGKGMSSSQAERFAREWRVVAQYDGKVEERYIDEFGQEQVFLNPTGLNATVFEEAETGRRYLAIRGTEPSDINDLLTDAVDIVSLGTTARQRQYAALKDKVAEWLGNGTLADGFTVSGHSLGGFLAIGLATEYASRIGHVCLYNTPGLGGVPPLGGTVTVLWLATQVWNALSPGGVPSGATAPISNIVAVGDLAAGLVGTPMAPPQRILIEQTADPLHNHSIVTLTDALAVYDLFGRLDGVLDLKAAGDILKATSSRSEATLEAAVRTLGRLFLPSAAAVAVGDRDALHRAIGDIRAALPAAGLTVVPLTAFTAAELHAAAGNPDALATRYALRELNPFAVLGADYSRFNQNGELNLYGPATGRGELTDEYLADRAALLAWQNLLNTRDVLTSQARPHAGSEVGEAALFADRASGTQIVLGGQLATRRKILFGAEGKDLLDGGALNDRLYGGAGRDVLLGEAGDDVLHANQELDPLAAFALGQSQSPDDGKRGQQRAATGNRGIEARGTPSIRKSRSACKPPIAANDFHGRVAA